MKAHKKAVATELLKESLIPIIGMFLGISLIVIATTAMPNTLDGSLVDSLSAQFICALAQIVGFMVTIHGVYSLNTVLKRIMWESVHSPTRVIIT